ncbi:nucleoside 2-deoxyribosyltransferase [Carnobacteriaceae bacterium zg-ZUI252]|nr:nucleoside 2-deoxyribosyltransferase [Carnobacteriaceae bacterium zg-ZUI252]MBS4769848.1 nucleoside 2-deoxyribosyltransferase [Carnobacteriaceae bacterium zg-ZUI240]QTU82638.1 nucleoside 2-deoxyribosyltransferase [Carnobacteriaceae bacterium zg-C25]
MTKIYFASPLFSEMELLYNEQLVKKIREHYPTADVYLPQEQASINDKNAYADSKAIAQYDTQALLESQLVIAVLDGAIIDVGVASEIGVAYQAGIPVLALYTDSRQKGATNQKKLDALQEIAESQFSYVNLYTVGLVKLNGKVVGSSEELLSAIAEFI